MDDKAKLELLKQREARLWELFDLSPDDAARAIKENRAVQAAYLSEGPLL